MNLFIRRWTRLLVAVTALVFLGFTQYTSIQALQATQATPTATALPGHDHDGAHTQADTLGATPQSNDGSGTSEPVAPDWVSACPGNTVPFETQAWWTEDFGHVHAGFCAPFGQKISGSYTFKVRLILHGNPGVLTTLRAQIDSTSYGSRTARVDLACPKTDTCGWDREVTMNTQDFPNDGWHTIRMRAVVREPDGKELVATTFIPVYLNNGKPVKHNKDADVSDRYDYVAGRGWYTDRNYIWSAIFAPPYANKTVSGTWAVRIRPAATQNPLPISRFIAKLDATHSAPGTIVYDSTANNTKDVNLTIDTKKLSNGWHSLLARTESAGQPSTMCAACSGATQTQAGVTKIWFNVRN